MNESGEYIGHQRVLTTATNLINQVVAIPGHVKKLTLEQSNIAFWASEFLEGHVDERIVCDPRHNALVSANQKISQTNRLKCYNHLNVKFMNDLNN